MIEVRDLSFRIGQKCLLQQINFEVKPGEMLAVIGANGAGKSTLMKLMCRELVPSGGGIRLKHKELSDYKIIELARMRSVLSQQNTISMAFNVKELVLMGRYPHFDSKPAENDFEILRQVMTETGITHLSDREYNTLSGGEQQRVQLARVMAQIWDVPNGLFFLDEPTNGLDLLYQQQILSIARNMADKGFCVISILHDINSASRYADKVLILKEGRGIAYGSPEEVINCENIQEAFGIEVSLLDSAELNYLFVIPFKTNISRELNLY